MKCKGGFLVPVCKPILRKVTRDDRSVYKQTYFDHAVTEQEKFM